MHKKIPKICTGCRVSTAKIYLYHSTEIAKARPHSGKQTVLSRSSGSWLGQAKTLAVTKIINRLGFCRFSSVSLKFCGDATKNVLKL